MTTKHSTNNDQFFRRFFDTLYQFEFSHVLETWQDIPRRTRWFLATSLTFMVLVWIIIQFISNATTLVDNANMPKLEERLNAPYELNTRNLPILGITQYLTPIQVGYTPATIDISNINPAYGCMVNGGGELCIETVEPTYNEAWQFTDPNVESFAEQMITYQTELEAYQIAFARAEALIIEQAMADALEGQPEGTTINIEDLVLPEVVTDIAEPVMPQMNTLPEIRVAITQFDSSATAHNAIETLFNTSRTVGNIGNYVLVRDVEVNYYYSVDDGWQSFTWAHENWVYTVSSPSSETMESVIETFPY